MKLRGWINRNSELVTVISVFLLVFSLVVLVKSTPRNGRVITRAYYYDVVTGKLFSGPAQDTPPIPTPDGSMKNNVFAGVRANVFACASCDDVKSHKIGYLETYTQEAREALESQRMMTEAMSHVGPDSGQDNPGTLPGPDPNEIKLMEVISRGRLVASTENTERWFPMESDEGMQLVTAAMKSCPGDRYATQCYPEE
jgi:hypothetical protein